MVTLVGSVVSRLNPQMSKIWDYFVLRQDPH